MLTYNNVIEAREDMRVKSMKSIKYKELPTHISPQ